MSTILLILSEIELFTTKTLTRFKSQSDATRTPTFNIMITDGTVVTQLLQLPHKMA